MSLRSDLIEAAKPFLEGASRDMINTNSTSCSELGIDSVNPGEFSPEEITDQENLVNVAKMSNDNDFNDESQCAEVQVSVVGETPAGLTDDMEELINLGLEDKEKLPDHESLVAAFESILRRASDRTLHESDYAGNLSYNPDKRLNASDVLNAVKNAVKPELAAALSIDKDVDANEEPIYVMHNIDEKDLPETIEIDTNTDEKVVLKKDGKSYKFDK